LLRKIIAILSIVFLVFQFNLLVGAQNQGKTYHVAINGDDNNPGTSDKPWRTISYAVTQLKPGDKLIIHEGVYKEVVVMRSSGISEAPIIITSAPGERVVLDFGRVSSNCFSLSKGVSHVRIENLTLVNCGIWALSLDGGNQHIILRNLEVAYSETGIHMTVGESGKKPWHGPVGPVLIEGCLVHDNDVGGIDCTPGPCYDIIIRYSKIYNNGVTAGFGADGVAVETGDRICIEWSEIYGNMGDGVDLGSRNPLWFNKSSDFRVSGCFVHDNGLEGVKLWTGGTVENTLIYSNGFTGLDFIYNGKYLVLNTAIVKNAVEIRTYSVALGYKELEPLGSQDNLEVEIYNSIIAFNGPPDAPTGIYVGPGVKLVSDYNIWYSRQDSEIYLESAGMDYTREDIASGKWTKDTGNGAHSIAADPLFVDIENDDYRLQSNSPAIDAANPDKSPSLDVQGAQRPWGQGYDIGPYEYGAEAPPRPSPLKPIEYKPQNETQQAQETLPEQPQNETSQPQETSQAQETNQTSQTQESSQEQTQQQTETRPSTGKEKPEEQGINILENMWLILIAVVALTLINIAVLITILKKRKQPLPPPPPPPKPG